MADVRGHPAAAMQQATVDHGTSADARADGDEHEMAQSLPGAELPFAIDGGDAVVLENNREPELAGQESRRGKSSQPGRVGMCRTVPDSVSTGPGALIPAPERRAASSRLHTSPIMRSNCFSTAEGPPATSVRSAVRRMTVPPLTSATRACVPPRSMPIARGADTVRDSAEVRAARQSVHPGQDR